MASPFNKAWDTLKALPEHNIREMAHYSSAYPMSIREREPRQMTTMHPVIARLARERNERRAADSGSKLHDFMRQRPDEPHELEQYSTDDRPSSTYGPQGRTQMPGPSYSQGKEQSKDAHEAQGVVSGDRFSGDYVTRPSGGTATDTGPRRSKTPFATKLEFPYGGRSGDYPVNVEPDSPMAQMYNTAPQLRQLPEGLQPEWMDEFRKAPMAKAWSTLKALPERQVHGYEATRRPDPVLRDRYRALHHAKFGGPNQPAMFQDVSMGSGSEPDRALNDARRTMDDSRGTRLEPFGESHTLHPALSEEYIPMIENVQPEPSPYGRDYGDRGPSADSSQAAINQLEAQGYDTQNIPEEMLHDILTQGSLPPPPNSDYYTEPPSRGPAPA